MATRQPKSIGGWNLLEQIGRGGQSRVWKAVRAEGAEGAAPRALKLLRLKDSKKIKRFVQEARSHATLSSQGAPNIIEILEHNLDDVERGTEEWGYLVLPLAVWTLDDSEVIDFTRGRVEVCLEVFEGIVQGVAAAHRARIVHRDLKPANVLFLDRTLKTPLVADFGICFFKSSEGRITSINETVGARFFMAPEQEKGGRVDVQPAADIYALGKVLCFMITGRRVFREDFVSEIEGALLEEEPRLALIRDEIFARTIVESPSDRVKDADELLKIVRELRRNFRGPTSGGGGSGSGGSGVGPVADTFARYGTQIASGKEAEVRLEFDGLKRTFDVEWMKVFTVERDKHSGYEELSRELILAQRNAVALTLAVARLDGERLFPLVKQFIDGVARAGEELPGSRALVGVPHVLAGFLYESSAMMSVRSQSWKIWKLLLSQKFQCFYESQKPLYLNGFDHAQFFHSDAFSRKSDKIHDFFRDLIKTEFLSLFGMTDEEAMSCYVQTQMLMCLRGAQLIERGEHISMFADFGRFYSWRVESLFEQMDADPGFAEGIASGFEETTTQFFERLDGRLKIIRSDMWGGGEYIWQSIHHWKPHGPSAAADGS